MLVSTASTATASTPPRPSPIMASALRLRPTRRRLSSTGPHNLSPLQLCKPSSPVQVHNLAAASPTQTLASLRFLVLSHLADLERHLSELESPDLESWKAKGGVKIEEARQWATTALDMLKGIRADVCSHLPDIQCADLASVENFLSAHIPARLNMSTLSGMRSHLPELPHFPEMPHLPAYRAHLPDLVDVRSTFDDVRSRFQEIDFNHPLNYVPTLSAHLQNLHSHLSSPEVELVKAFGVSSLAPSSLLHQLLAVLLASELTEITGSKPDSIDFKEEAKDAIEVGTSEVSKAVKRSLEGMCLITYDDLPPPWKNNPFVTQGYRFIPLERWPLLIKSIFTLHNETLNIHTHLVPFILYIINIVSILRNPTYFDATEVLFMSFACVCLLASTIWHVMSGCAHHSSMELCARVDYVGIGWLISASVGTVIHYGYQCHPDVGRMFLLLCLLMGLMGNIFPFMPWFNQHEYRSHRVCFFLALAFSGLGPLAGMAILHSHEEMSEFIAPLLPSFASYLIGLAFYAYHWPERHLPESLRMYLDRIGGGSHAIWHCFIVLAVSQHKHGMQAMKEGFQCLAEFSSTLGPSG